MQYHDINYLNLENEIEVYNKREFKNCNFQDMFFYLEYFSY